MKRCLKNIEPNYYLGLASFLGSGIFALLLVNKYWYALKAEVFLFVIVLLIVLSNIFFVLGISKHYNSKKDIINSKDKFTKR